MASRTRKSPIFIYIHQWSSVQHILSSEVAFQSSHHADCTSALSSGTLLLGWNSSCSSEIPPICFLIVILVTFVKVQTIIASLCRLQIHIISNHPSCLDLHVPFRWTTTWHQYTWRTHFTHTWLSHHMTVHHFRKIAMVSTPLYFICSNSSASMDLVALHHPPPPLLYEVLWSMVIWLWSALSLTKSISAPSSPSMRTHMDELG